MMVGGASSFRMVAAALFLMGMAAAQEHISFPTQDGGLVYADEYGKGDRGVVLAHGGQFNDQAERVLREIVNFLSEP